MMGRGLLPLLMLVRIRVEVLLMLMLLRLQLPPNDPRQPCRVGRSSCGGSTKLHVTPSSRSGSRGSSRR